MGVISVKVTINRSITNKWYYQGYCNNNVLSAWQCGVVAYGRGTMDHHCLTPGGWKWYSTSLGGISNLTRDSGYINYQQQD